ncbi:Aste57867_2428 [Aphanomyces stellatus]|uniref:Aste57867_2428 protein n=1 Tax=Aphanomyces stellatus TaxID=120398 RepID=A0A485K7M7_9STRA|nr:hypothetical protein As57867_002422 [Aphanomyces stellatus]VFT79629.1 Aste57867_2428 [Aphanomyces stellatus]
MNALTDALVCKIPDAATLFLFLEALGTTEARGSLEPLWQLGMVFGDREELWPQLVVTPQLAPTPSPLHDDRPMGDPFAGTLDEWLEEWARLRLTNLTMYDTISRGSDQPLSSTAQFFAALPRYQHLMCLDLDGRLDLTAIFKVAALTTQLTELKLSYKLADKGQINTTTAALRFVVNGLKRPPSVSFAFQN